MACKGCQSFCMQGHQLAINGPEGSGSNYSDIWIQWENIKSYSEDSGNNSIIQTADTLSAKSQLSLIDFIKAVYSEGKMNPNDGLKYDEVKVNGLNLEADGVSIDSTNLDGAKLDGITKEDIQSNSIIFAHNYNNLLQPLISDEFDPISSDPKGKALENSNNATQKGPVAGWPSNENVALVTSGATDNSDNSIIKASLYTDLYDKASRLMYHPYQCNECNIYQGGDWLEICKQTKQALAQVIKDSGFYPGPKEDPNSQYSWYGESPVSVNGKTISVRRDCSGYVSACIYFYGQAQGITTGYNWSTQNFSESGEGGQALTQLGFTPKPGDSSILAGDVEVNLALHMQVAAEDGGRLVYNAGSNSSISNPGATSGGSHTWDILWGAPEGSAFGDSTIMGGGGSASDYSDDWIVTGCTYYGTSAGDDNMLTGWLGYYYPNISGCHVAVPCYLLGSTWHYGDLIVLKYYDRVCRCVVADCGGGFGPEGGNDYADFDLPPNTMNALGITDNVHRDDNLLFYQRIGHIDSWDGGPV